MGKFLSFKEILSLVLFWIIVFVFQLFGDKFLIDLTDFNALLLFAVIFITVITASFFVVKQADVIAHSVGEPYGTLILTLSIVIIEVVLIVAMLFGPTETPEIAKDSVFSVLMIILNLVLGISLFLGGRKFGEQAYNSQGTMTYLSLILLLGGLGLLLPGFIEGKGNGEFTTAQAIFISVGTFILYGYFIKSQIGQYNYIFKQPLNNELVISYEDKNSLVNETANSEEKLSKNQLIVRTIILILYILPIVLLSHNLSTIVDYGITKMELPVSLGGILIALIVFTPESITAIKATLSNEMQRTINLCHGASVSTIGLTIPAVLIIGLLMEKQVILALTNVEIVLFIITILLSFLTFNGRRTTPILGLIHLVLFSVYILLVFNP